MGSETSATVFSTAAAITVEIVDSGRSGARDVADLKLEERYVAVVPASGRERNENHLR